MSQSSDNQVRIDSLEALLSADRSFNEQKVDVLNQLGFEYWIVDPTKSVDYGIEALEIAKLLPYPSGRAFANRVIGVAHWAKGNLELSFAFLVAAERDYRALGDSLGLANSMLNLGMAYADQHKFALARQKYQNALGLFERRGERSRIATTYTKLSDVLIAQQEYDPAFNYLRKALDIHNTNEFLYGIAEVNSKLGKLATAKGDYNDAISYFLLAVEAGSRRNDRVGLAEYFHGIGNANFQKGDFSQANNYLAQAKTIAEGYGLNKMKREIYNTYKDLESAKGNYRVAIQYYDQYLAVKDSLFNAEKSNIIANMEAQRAYEEKEQELVLAQKNLDFLVEKSKADRLKILTLILGILALVGITWGLLQRKNRVLAQKQAALREAREQTGELEDAIRSKEQELTSYTLNFVQKNEMISELRKDLNAFKKRLGGANSGELEAIGRKLDTVLRVDEDWTDFRKHFESVHPRLMNRLNQDFPGLTKNEFRLIALVRLNLSSKEISSVLGISPDSVKTARYRLRKKLGLENQQDLFDFLLAYDG